MVSSILPKNENWGDFMYWKLSQQFVFVRIEDIINCFRDLLIFSKEVRGSNLQLLSCYYFLITITEYIFEYLIEKEDFGGY